MNKAMQTLLIDAGAPVSLWPDCQQGVWDARENIVRPGCMKAPVELLTVVKPSVAYLHSFGGKVWALVTDSTRKASEAKLSPGLLPCCLSFGKYQMILEHGNSVETTRRYLGREDQPRDEKVDKCGSGERERDRGAARWGLR